jgi:hypothetical protein
MRFHIKSINTCFIKQSRRKIVIFGVDADACFNRIVVPAWPVGQVNILAFAEILFQNSTQCSAVCVSIFGIPYQFY